MEIQSTVRVGEQDSLLRRAARWAEGENNPLSALEALRRGPAPPRRLRAIDRWFPPREFLLRHPHEHGSARAIALHFSQGVQIAALGVVTVSLACFLVTAAVAAWNRHAADRMAREVADLRGTVQLESAHAAEIRDILGRLGPELSRSVAERDKAATAAFVAGRSLAGTMSDIDRLNAERARLTVERDRAVAERDAALSANRQMLAELDTQTRSAIARVEGVIAATGLDAARAMRVPVIETRMAARGGPFVPWRDRRGPGSAAEMMRVDRLSSGIDRLRELRGFLSHLPLASPLGHLDISAGYGFRLDPFSRMAAAHEGLDLAGPYGMPVQATATGLVSFAGWRGEYGNLVEIDHGLGLVTRYAHLGRIDVKPGDRVTQLQTVGTLGATGRVTGPHLHYETRVDGQARNPLNFLKATRHVQ